MDRAQFHRLLKKYLQGNCTPEEEQLVHEWYQLLEDEMPQSLTEQQFNELENRLWNNISSRTTKLITTADKNKKRQLTPIVLKWMAAASVVILLSLLFYWMQSQRSSTPGTELVQNNPVNEEFNSGNQVRSVMLEDGSEVQLEPGARLSFPTHFSAGKREVSFEGEGFFKIARNPQSPFFVYYNNLVTEVLGTSFRIRTINNQVEVAVKTGRVAVYEKGKKPLPGNTGSDSLIIITANERLTYMHQEKQFISSLVEKPEPVVNPEDGNTNSLIRFVYDDTPLINVLRSIEKAYQIKIIIENPAINNCTFSGDITSQDLYKKLELLCQAFQATYEIKGTIIYIQGGKGCN